MEKLRISSKKFKRLIKEGKLIPYEQVFNEDFPTDEDKARFWENYKKLVEENDRELLKESAAKLKKARLKKGLTQEALAQAINSKKSSISRLERGDQNISLKYLHKVARALDVSVRIEMG